MSAATRWRPLRRRHREERPTAGRNALVVEVERSYVRPSWGARGAKETAGGRVPVDTGTASTPGFGQFAVTSIILGFAACGAGTLTSSMPFACFAFTSAASTPLGSSKLRWNAPYAISRTK